MATGFLRLGGSRIIARVALAVCVAYVSQAGAAANCDAQYQQALAAVSEGHLDRGSQQTIESHLSNAKEMSGRGNAEAALHQLDVALRKLSAPPMKRVPTRARERLQRTITAFRNCLQVHPAGLATLVVTTVYQSDDGSQFPTGPGVHIRINGETLAQSDKQSSATVTVSAGAAKVVALVPSTAIVSLELSLAPGEWRELTLVLDDSKEVTEPNPLVLHQLNEGVIAASFDAFVLSFAGESGAQALQGIDYIHIEHPQGGMPVRVDHLFTLSDSGEMVAHDLEQLRGLLVQQPHGLITILVHAYDEEGFSYANTVQFYLGRYQIVGHLVAPPSFPDLDPAGIEVTVNVLGADLSFTTVTDAAGHFSVDDIPMGNVGFDSSTFQDERYFYGQGIVVLQGNRSVTITMRNVEDIQGRDLGSDSNDFPVRLPAGERRTVAEFPIPIR